MCTVDAEMARQIRGPDSESGPKPVGDVRLQVSGSNLKVDTNEKVVVLMDKSLTITDLSKVAKHKFQAIGLTLVLLVCQEKFEAMWKNSQHGGSPLAI